MSVAVLVISITSFIGFLLNSTILFLVLSRGRQKYHYLFAGFLFICALWDIGIFLSMIRNSHVNELPIYGNVIWQPCTFMFAIIYHFTCNYLNQPRKKRTIFIWVASAIAFILGVTGLGGKIVGVYSYSWGNIFQPDSMMLNSLLFSAPIIYFFGLSALWYLFRAYKHETFTPRKRHILYILVSFSIIHLATSKIAILFGIDNGFWMPTCMLLNDIASSLIGIAIIKHGLFDITVVIKKTTIYSALLAIIIFVFSFSEHMLATYVGQIFGEQSMYIHLISIAVVIAVVMPIRQRIERGIERFFAGKMVDF